MRNLFDHATCIRCWNDYWQTLPSQRLCGACLKDFGIAAAEGNAARRSVLVAVRESCRDAAAIGCRDVTIEDGYWLIHKRGGPTPEELAAELGPASGSVFKGSDWEFTGERRKTKRRKSHARELKVWRLFGVSSTVHDPLA